MTRCQPDAILLFFYIKPVFADRPSNFIEKIIYNTEIVTFFLKNVLISNNNFFGSLFTYNQLAMKILLPRIARKHALSLSIFLISFIHSGIAQVAPYSYPPKWFFGHRAGMDFTGGAPVLMGGNTWEDASIYSNQEGSTVECLPNGNVLYYSNSCRTANATHGFIGPDPFQGGGNSSSQGCLSIPNPSNPTGDFYLFFTDVDNSGGSNCANPAASRGLFAYPISSTYTVGAPIQMSTDVLGEFIAASSDNNDGYWIVSHDVSGGGSTNFKVWHLPRSGTINTTPSTQAGTVNGVNWKYQGGIKFNKCNTRIAFFSNNGFEVRNWDATTGTIGSLIRSNTAGGWGIAYGVEFSPDGNQLYLSDYNGGLYHYNITTGTGPTLVSASNSGTGSSQGPGYGNLILGPDNKIYLSNRYGPGDAIAGGKYIAVINTPNSTTAAGCGFAQTGGSAFQLSSTATAYPSTAAGLITLGWHNPVLNITGAITPTCETFSYTYKQYYGATIAVNAGSEQWDFGDGNTATGVASPSHVYAANGTYTITLSVTDVLCNQRYESQKSITVSCPMPVELIEFNVRKAEGGALLNWATSLELNNDYFEIQHSLDGKNFTSIGTIDGHGTTTILQQYSFLHANPASGVNYYRLVQHDYNGHYDYSPVKSLNYEGLHVNVIPNPTNNVFNLYISGASSAEIQVYDVVGRAVYHSSTSDVKNELVSFGDDLPKGAYLVKVITPEGSKTVKVIKE